MKLHLITADAREVVADVQFVKHFNGLIGGAEAALNDAIGRRLEPVLAALDSNRFLNSQLVQVSGTGNIGSRNLLVLNLGEIGRFTLGDLEGAIAHAINEALRFKFETVATPVIGISSHVGLPIERAYRTVLRTIISTLATHASKTGSIPSITDIVIFDCDPGKVAFFNQVTPSILSEIDVPFRQLSSGKYDIRIEEIVKESVSIAVAGPSYTIEEIAPGAKLIRPDIIKVLFLAANPTDMQPLRLDQEIRAIDAVLRQSAYRDRFDIRQQWAVRVTDLQGHLLHHQPHIVHFSGHGSKSNGIILEDLYGRSQLVSPRALSRLFSVLKDNIRCVVLNACYSEVQAQAIAEHIDCVVGMSSSIGNKAAISFAAAFYQALGYGKDVKTAFDLGCVQIDLESLSEQDIPKLMATRVDPRNIRFV